MDAVGSKLASIEERFHYLDENLTRPSMEKTLISLKMQLEELDVKMDEMSLRMLTGESSLRSRKRAMLDRCAELQTEIGTKLRDIRSI